MNHPYKYQFGEIRMLIESGNIQMAAEKMQALVWQLGGVADLTQMSPAAVSIYMTALIMERA